MRRIIRPGFLAVLSLLLCVAAAGLWVRSFGYYDALRYAGGDRRVDFSIQSDRGILEFSRWSSRSNHTEPLRWNFDNYASDDGWRFQYPTGYRLGAEWPVEGGFNRFGFMYAPGPTAFAVPHWFVVVLAGAVPVTYFSRRVRAGRRCRRRVSQGRCPSCGYDLRATPGQCPECGTQARPNGDGPGM